MPTFSANWLSEEGHMQIEGQTGERKNTGNFAQRINFTLKSGDKTRKFEGNINPSYSRISGQYHEEDSPEKSFFFEFQLAEKVKGTLRLARNGQRADEAESLEI